MGTGMLRVRQDEGGTCVRSCVPAVFGLTGSEIRCSSL